MWTRLFIANEIIINYKQSLYKTKNDCKYSHMHTHTQQYYTCVITTTNSLILYKNYKTFQNRLRLHSHWYKYKCGHPCAG